jgi:hypothetical protein
MTSDREEKTSLVAYCGHGWKFEDHVQEKSTSYFESFGRPS